MHVEWLPHRRDFSVWLLIAQVVVFYLTIAVAQVLLRIMAGAALGGALAVAAAASVVLLPLIARQRDFLSDQDASLRVRMILMLLVSTPYASYAAVGLTTPLGGEGRFAFLAGGIVFVNYIVSAVFIGFLALNFVRLILRYRSDVAQRESPAGPER